MAGVQVDGPKRQPAADDRGMTSGPKPATPGREQLPATAAPPLPYAAFVANAHFFGDFCIAVALPMFMLGSIARSLDPRVGAAWATGGAAPDTLAGPQAKGPLCLTPAALGALEGFPYGSSLGLQALHVARHLVWYALLRPARQRDWAGLLLNGVHLLCAGVGLLLAISSRTSAVWAWWRRNRVMFVLSANLLARCVLLLAAFLLLPPHTWPSLTWAAYVVNATSSPLAHALAIGVHNLLVKVPLPVAVVQALAHTAAVFVLAYHVAPTVVTGQRQQHRAFASPMCAVGGPIPLQCGSPLRPEHSALLSCRPLALQVLLGLAMVAWPVGLAWAVDRRLRRQHVAVCREGERRIRHRSQQGDVPHIPSCAQQQPIPPCSKAAHLDNPHGGRDKGAASGRDCKAPDGPLPRETPAEAHAVGPCSGTLPAPAGAPRPSACYRSRMTIATASVKVKEHPGDYKEYGRRLASVLRKSVREELGSRAAAGTASSQQAAALEPLLWTTVIRGCVEVVLWGWVHERQGQVLGGAGADGVGNPVLAEGLAKRLAARLDQEMAHEGGGSVRGVSVQVGQVVVLGDPSPDVQLPGLLPLYGDSGGGGGSGTSIRLLQMSPPAASLPAAAAPGSLTVRLLLHSPTSQPARVLVLAERQGDASSAEPVGEPLGNNPAPRARMLLELPVQLVGGVQEVEVEVALGAGQLAGAGEVDPKEGQGVAADEADAVSVLRVMMVGPEHQPVSAAGQREEAARPSPLVHWVAPPLLLLPPAAAAEVCSAWEAMQREAAGGPGPADEEQRASVAARAVSTALDETAAAAKGLYQCTSWGQQGRGQQQEPRGDESVGTSQHARTLPPSGFSSELLASAELQSSLWWSHMAPLLGDLAHALGGHGMWQDGDAEAANPVWQALLPYLQGRGMAETLSVVLERRRLDHHSHRHQQPSTGVGAYLAAPYAYFPTRRPLLFSLPRPFSPPSLERQYQQWRLERLAHMTPYALLVFDASATSIVLLRALVTEAPLPVGAAPLPLRLVHIVVFMLLTTVADTLGLVVLYIRAVWRPSNQRQQQQLQEQGGQEGAGVAASRRTALIDFGDMMWYQLATCVAGPAVLLLCGAQTFLGLTPVDPRAAGEVRFLYGIGLNRAVVVPSLQQMSTWEAVAAAPLLGCGEALLMMHMQPTWGAWRAGAAAAVWRLVAVGVSAAWERRSRGRFMQGQQQQAAGAAVGDRQGSGAGESHGGSKKSV